MYLLYSDIGPGHSTDSRSPCLLVRSTLAFFEGLCKVLTTITDFFPVSPFCDRYLLLGRSRYHQFASCFRLSIFYSGKTSDSSEAYHTKISGGKAIPNEREARKFFLSKPHTAHHRGQTQNHVFAKTETRNGIPRILHGKHFERHNEPRYRTTHNPNLEPALHRLH